jgi:hypothetical protein
MTGRAATITDTSQRYLAISLKVQFDRQPQNCAVLPAVAKLSSDDAIQQHRQRTLLQLRATCNKYPE